MESLCWSCSRAYAKPDPEDCGFHRTKNKLAYIEKANFIVEVKIEDRINAKHEPMKVILVTRCHHYNREKRHIESSAAAKGWETRRERDRQEGIA